jgi:Cof subfamily protein (haloacid dehalogenase superfamily)
VKIRLVAFDLDGTVLSRDNRISDASVKTIREMVASGIHVASVSGRNVQKSRQPFRELDGLPEKIHIGSYNGALVLTPEGPDRLRLIADQRLSCEHVAELIAFIEEVDTDFIFCQSEMDDGIVTDTYVVNRESDSTRDLERQVSIKLAVDADLLPRVKAGELKDPPKMVLITGQDRRDDILRQLRDRMEDRCYVARVETDRIEIMDSEVNKAEALKRLAETCGVTMDEVMAIGDGDNDLPMLGAAGTGVLMGNADVETQKEAVGLGATIGRRFDEEGFSAAVKELVLQD